MPKGLILYPKDGNELGGLRWVPGMFSACAHMRHAAGHAPGDAAVYFQKARAPGGGASGKHVRVRLSCLFLEVEVTPVMVPSVLFRSPLGRGKLGCEVCGCCGYGDARCPHPQVVVVTRSLRPVLGSTSPEVSPGLQDQGPPAGGGRTSGGSRMPGGGECAVGRGLLPGAPLDAIRGALAGKGVAVGPTVSSAGLLGE